MNIVTQFVLYFSSRQSSINEDDQDLLTSCKQVVFNPAHRHIVLCVFSTEIHVIDLDVDLTVSTMRLDRSSPNFAKVVHYIKTLHL
jgi:hypothetical protein